MLKEDGSVWFSLNIQTSGRSSYESEIHKESEIVQVWYQDESQNMHVSMMFFDTGIPIVPHSWYHICLGLDTVSGLLRIVVNGVKVVDEEKEFFRNTSAWKPQSLAGKLLVFKGYNIAWAQYRGKFTNMNIFSSMISLEDMMMRTSGVADDCTGPGDYLSWADMEWSVSGDVTSGVMIQEELCQRY